MTNGSHVYDRWWPHRLDKAVKRTMLIRFSPKEGLCP